MEYWILASFPVLAYAIVGLYLLAIKITASIKGRKYEYKSSKKLERGMVKKPLIITLILSVIWIIGITMIDVYMKSSASQAIKIIFFIVLAAWGVWSLFFPRDLYARGFKSGYDKGYENGYAHGYCGGPDSGGER